MSTMIELTLKKPDGSLFTRIEAEKELWDKCKTSHMMRRLANGQYGLDPRFAWMLKPTSITHWILDELIRKKLIAGEQIGIHPEQESDDAYFNTYIQKLRVFVEDGRALAPKEGEGIDMSDFQQMPPNGQPPQAPGYSPPPPPPMGYGQPPAQPQQQFQPPPMPQQQGFAPPQGAPPPFGGQPQAPQFGAPPQQQMPSFPPQGAPPPVSLPQQMQPPGMPQQQFQPPQGMPQMAPPQGAPPAPPAQSPSNRRKKADGPPGALPGQQAMPFPQMPAPPQGGFAAPPAQGGMPAFGQPPQFGAPQQMSQQAAPGDHAALGNGGSNAQIAQLLALVESQAKTIAGLAETVGDLRRTIKAIDVVVGMQLRQIYQRAQPQHPNELGTESAFKEIGLPYPT